MSIKVVYDPLQHFHLGFHKPTIDNPAEGWKFVKGHINFFFDEEMNSSPETENAKKVLVIGEMAGKGDLFFSPHTLLVGSVPWFVDIEHVDWFFMNSYLAIPEEEYLFEWKIKIARKILESNSCKFILCRSKYALKTVSKLFESQKISKKSVLFYPVQPLRPFAINESKVITLGIIISSYADYYRKGGDIALRVFQELKHKHPDLQLIYVGQLPPKRFLFNPEKIPGLVHYPTLSHKTIINKIFPKIDILLFPSRADSFGTVVLEAMSFGKPVVANVGRHVYGIKEIVKDGTNGFAVSLPEDSLPIHANSQNVNFKDFLDKTNLLLESYELRKKIGKNARHFIQTELSVNSMNKILSRLEGRIKLG